MELEGSNVVKYLNGPDTVRDGFVVDFSVRRLNTEPIIELIFEVPHKAGSRIVRLELREVLEFDYSYLKDNSPTVVEMMKCLMTDEGDFFLSLDPYDEREAFISDKDNEFFRSRFVKLTASEFTGTQGTIPNDR